MAANNAVNTILEHGREMRKIYCPKRDRSLMFPPAPRSKFVDKFPENVKTKREQKELVQQTQYESEVKVYKALENMNIGLTVLHGFSYTHKQFGIFVRDHIDNCNKKDEEEEGECDFLAIHDQFLAVMEVKAPDLKQSKDPDKIFKKTLSESKRQRDRTKELILGIRKRMKVKVPTVIELTIFSDVEQCVVDQLPSYKVLKEEEKKSILFADDLAKMQSIFLKYIQKDQEVIHERVSSTLLGIWYFDNFTGREKSDNVELSMVIENVDLQLRTSKISRVGSKSIQSPVSSSLALAPKNLRKLDIKYLTKDQESILKNDRKKLWINGPAGSGKTLLIIGKILELLEENDESKVIIVVLNETVAKEYKQRLKTADVTSIIINDQNVDDTNFKQETKLRLFFFYFKKSFHKGVPLFNDSAMIKSVSRILETGYHIFMDDFHGLTEGMGYNGTKDLYDIAFTELRSASNRTFWVTYDILQYGFMTEPIRSSCKMREVVNNVDKNSFKSLSAVLRNSHQLADLLSSLRKLRLENEKAYLKIVRESSSPLNRVPPSDEEFQKFYGHLSLNQETGHFIHGPKPQLYMLCTQWSNTAAIVKKTKEILKEQILRLRSTKTSIIVDRTILLHQRGPLNAAPTEEDERARRRYAYGCRPEYSDDEVNWESECENLLKSMNHSVSSAGNETDISVNYFDETFSAEWPAVIGIVEFSRRMFCRENMVSVNVGNVLCNSETMFDQLLSKIYITVSRARVYCCLILIMRDLDVYIRIKKDMDTMYFSTPGLTTTLAEINKTKGRVGKDIVELENCLCSHMLCCENYSCQSETATEMTKI